MLDQMQELWGACSNFGGSGEGRGSPNIHTRPVPEHLGGKVEGFHYEGCVLDHL